MYIKEKDKSCAFEYQGSCKTCPEGYYCDGTIQNNTFCSTGVQNPTPCQPGYYCPNGTKYATEFGCPNGTYSDQSYLKQASECITCPGGKYCGQEGLSAPSGDCHGGYVCILGATSATPTDGTTGKICDAGGYCPVGSNSTTLCLPGSYNPTQGRLSFLVTL